MVHNNPTMLNCFIKQLLQYQGSVVFIHVDEKGLNIIPDIIEDPRVIIIPEHYNGSWGDYSQIQMVNALIKNAINNGDFDYYSLHSGVDLCVREVSEFADYLSKNNLYGFYECTKLPSTWQYGGGVPGNVYQETNGESGLQRWPSKKPDTNLTSGLSTFYHACGETHEASAMDNFVNGYYVSLQSGKVTNVIIWRGKDGHNVHCTTQLNMDEWATAKS